MQPTGGWILALCFKTVQRLQSRLSVWVQRVRLHVEPLQCSHVSQLLHWYFWGTKWEWESQLQLKAFNKIQPLNGGVSLSPVMPFPCRLILSSVAISVNLSGKTEKLLFARLMQVKCSISPTLAGSLVRTFPRRSSSAIRQAWIEGWTT